MSLWYAVIRDEAILHCGQDRSVAAFHYAQNEGSWLFTVQSLGELDSYLKVKPKSLSAQNVGLCCGGKPCAVDPQPFQEDELRKSFQVVKETTLDLLRKVGVSEDDVNEFAEKVKASVDEISSNIKAGGEQAVENTKNLGQTVGKTVGGWFTAIGEKLSK